MPCNEGSLHGSEQRHRADLAGDGSRLVVAGPIGVVERQPTRELRVCRVLPEAVPAAAPLHIVDEIAQAVVVARETAARGKVEQEGGVDRDVEGEYTRGPLPADQSG